MGTHANRVRIRDLGYFCLRRSDGVEGERQEESCRKVFAQTRSDARFPAIAARRLRRRKTAIPARFQKQIMIAADARDGEAAAAAVSDGGRVGRGDPADADSEQSRGATEHRALPLQGARLQARGYGRTMRREKRHLHTHALTRFLDALLDGRVVNFEEQRRRQEAVRDGAAARGGVGQGPGGGGKARLWRRRRRSQAAQKSVQLQRPRLSDDQPRTEATWMLY